MNMTMLTSALNGIMVDGVFVRNEDIESMTWECNSCGDRHLNTTRSIIVDGDEWCEACADEDSFVCENCGCRHNAAYAYEVRSFSGIQLWCEGCHDYHSVTCYDCDECVDEDYATYIGDGLHICNDCIDGWSMCDDCNTWHRRDDLTEVRGGREVCNDCLEYNYTHCDECDEWVLDEDYDADANMCYDCAEEHAERESESEAPSLEEFMESGEATIEDSNDSPRSDNARVRGYHCAPPMRWFGEPFDALTGAHMGIGVELEVDIKRGDSAQFMQRALNRIDRIAGDRLHFEHDGSLRNGFEIITQPHTVEAFNEIPWAEIMRACMENGFSSHDAETCGLHVHFSREMFGLDTETQDDNIAKLIQFIDMHWDDMVRASRRTNEQLGSWCTKKGTISKKQIKSDVTNKRGSRYNAVNNTNPHTVEIRLMRGTLNHSTFMATIDLLTTLVKNACRIGWDEVCEADEMLSGISPNTASYLLRQNAFYDTARRIGY